MKKHYAHIFNENKITVETVLSGSTNYEHLVKLYMLKGENFAIIFSECESYYDAYFCGNIRLTNPILKYETQKTKGIKPI